MQVCAQILRTDDLTRLCGCTYGPGAGRGLTRKVALKLSTGSRVQTGRPPKKSSAVTKTLFDDQAWKQAKAALDVDYGPGIERETIRQELIGRRALCTISYLAPGNSFVPDYSRGYEPCV